MQLSSFSAVGLQGLLAAEKPPVWALSVLEDSMDMMRESGDRNGIKMLETHIKRIEDTLMRRCGP